MRLNYGEIFQEKSKDRKMDGLVNIPNDSTLWPDLWKIVEYKEYERFASIKLPTPISKDISNQEMTKRRSFRGFLSADKNKKISLQDFSDIIYYSCGEVFKSVDGKSNRRVQASAGSRYPLELYILNFKEGDLKKKCYHYNVKNHALEELWSVEVENKEDVNKYFTHPYLRKLMSFPVLFLGAKPKDTPALYSLMNYADIKLGTWYPMGGMCKIAEAMYSLALELGVKFKFNENCTSIEIKDKK